MSKIETRMDQLEQFVQVLTKQILEFDHKNNQTISRLNEIDADLDRVEGQFEELEKWHKRMFAGLTAKQKKRIEIKGTGGSTGKRYASE